MAISFPKNCKDRCPVFSSCFGVIPGHIWGKNGTRPVINPTYWNFSEANTAHWTLDNRPEMSVLFLQLPDQTKFYFDVTIFLQTTLILQSAIQY